MYIYIYIYTYIYIYIYTHAHIRTRISTPGGLEVHGVRHVEDASGLGSTIYYYRDIYIYIYIFKTFRENQFNV